MLGSMAARRARRSPEEARALILAAAQRLFAERGPDAVGLKDVAAAAGVSHALVTHYFGTYEALVEAALEARANASRALLLRRIAEAPDDLHAWIDALFEGFADPVYGRLAAWAMLSGRAASAEFFPRRDRGMKQVGDVLFARFGGRVPRARLEHAMVLVFTAAIGYSLGEDVLAASLGKRATAARAAEFRTYLFELLSRELPLDRRPR